MKNIGDIPFYLAILFGVLIMSTWAIAFIIKLITFVPK